MSVSWGHSEETLHIHCSGLLGHSTLELVELYLEDVQEMAVCSVVALGGETAQLLLRSLSKDLFESVDLYSEDDLEMAICCSGLLGEKALHMSSYIQEMFLKW